MMKHLSRLLFLICLPGILWCYPAEFSSGQPSSILTFSPWDFLNLEHLSSDRIFDFTEMIENTENLEEVFSENELTAIEDFFIYLAKNGIRDWDVDAQEELEEDISWLVETGDTSRYFLNKGEDTSPTWMIPFFDFNKLKLSPASLIPSCKPHITLCKNKSKNPFKKIKQFIKKHKKAIIIGAVAVVAVVIITIATQGTGTAPALAAGSGGVAGADNSNKKPKSPVNKPGEVPFRENEIEQGGDQHQAPLSHAPQPMHPPSVNHEVSNVIDQKTSEMKETLSVTLPEPNSPPNQGKTQIVKEVREAINHTGSFLTHQAVDAVDEFLKVGPEFCEAMKEVGGRVFQDRVSFPKFPGSEEAPSPTQAHNQSVAQLHHAIDTAFGTNQADLYTPEAKALKDEKITIGVLPPPGSLGKGLKTPSKAYQAALNGGKHGGEIPRLKSSSNREIQKSIRSYQKNIAEHKDKMKNPRKHYPEWDNLHPNRKKALVERIWPDEIKSFEEHIDICQDILLERGSYE